MYAATGAGTRSTTGLQSASRDLTAVLDPAVRALCGLCNDPRLREVVRRIAGFLEAADEVMMTAEDS